MSDAWALIRRSRSSEGDPRGLALASAAARAGSRTWLYSRKKHEGALPQGVTQTEDYRQVGEVARLVILAVPSQTAGEVVFALGDHLDGRHLVVHGIRGLAKDTMAPISDVIRRECPVRRIGAIGGPLIADDLAAGRPSVMVVGSAYPEVRRAVADAYVTPMLRLYETDDLRGLEWASALVACLMIGAGYGKAAGVGAGLVAAFIARGIQESGRIAAAAGGDERTLLGLAGYGDPARRRRAAWATRDRARRRARPRKVARGGKGRRRAQDRGARPHPARVRVGVRAQGEGADLPRRSPTGISTARPVADVVRALMTSPVEGFV